MRSRIEEETTEELLGIYMGRKAPTRKPVRMYYGASYITFRGFKATYTFSEALDLSLHNVRSKKASD